MIGIGNFSGFYRKNDNAGIARHIMTQINIVLGGNGMPEEMKILLTQRIHRDLKERVRAKVYVKIDRCDSLIIEMEHDGFHFRYHNKSFLDYIFGGQDILMMENEVLRSYRSAILAKYFYR